MSAYNDAYLHACLRHDFTWRTLAVMDRATGKIWNERNRSVADDTFQDDAITGCGIKYKDRRSSRFIMREWTNCINASSLFYAFLRDWKYDKKLNGPERSSVASKPNEYVLFPGGSATVDCGVVGSANRCLPIHYIEIDGRPLSPQNMPYFGKDRTAKMQVVRANLQAPDGPPTTRTPTKATGELRLTVKWPLRAGKTAAKAACPTGSGTPGDQTIDVDYDDWPLPTPIVTTTDEDYKETTLYVTACADTTSSTEAAGLISIKPLNALYVTRVSRYRVTPAAQVRHYENVKIQSCDEGTSLALSSSGMGYNYGSWLGTDCLYKYGSRPPYIDYHDFTLTSNMVPAYIDLEYRGKAVNSTLYLYRIQRDGSRYILGLNGGRGDNVNPRIKYNLYGDTYSVGVSADGQGTTGDYKIRVGRTPGCDIIPLATGHSNVQVSGEWEITDCQTTRRVGRYADHYSFELVGPSSRTVTIDLESDTDTYLFLIKGDSAEGSGFFAKNDDISSRDRNSRISMTLEPGPYVIVATSYQLHNADEYSLWVKGMK